MGDLAGIMNHEPSRLRLGEELAPLDLAAREALHRGGQQAGRRELRLTRQRHTVHHAVGRARRQLRVLDGQVLGHEATGAEHYWGAGDGETGGRASRHVVLWRRPSAIMRWLLRELLRELVVVVRRRLLWRVWRVRLVLVRLRLVLLRLWRRQLLRLR